MPTLIMHAARRVNLAVCLPAAGIVLLSLATFNLAFAANNGPCEGVVSVSTVTGQVQGPWCKQNSCAASCLIAAVTCNSVEGQACTCPGAAPTVVCEITKTATGKMCCPDNCPPGKSCSEKVTHSFPDSEPSQYRDNGVPPGTPPPDDGTTDWAQCECK